MQKADTIACADAIATLKGKIRRGGAIHRAARPRVAGRHGR
jgi:hypothetical protein